MVEQPRPRGAETNDISSHTVGSGGKRCEIRHGGEDAHSVHTYIHAVYAYSALVSSGRGMDVTRCWVAVASGLRPTIPAASPTPDRLLW